MFSIYRRAGATSFLSKRLNKPWSITIAQSSVSKPTDTPERVPAGKGILAYYTVDEYERLREKLFEWNKIGRERLRLRDEARARLKEEKKGKKKTKREKLFLPDELAFFEENNLEIDDKGKIQPKGTAEKLAERRKLALEGKTVDTPAVEVNVPDLPAVGFRPPNTPIFSLDAEIRTVDASRLCRRLRREGRVPGVIYGNDDDGNKVKILVTTSMKAIAKELHLRSLSLENTLYELKLNDGTGRKFIVSPRQLTLDALRDTPLTVNFLIYRPNTRMRIPFKLINQADNLDIKRGSFFATFNKFADVICSRSLPQYLLVDVSKIKPNTVVRLAEYPFPSGVRVHPSVKIDSVPIGKIVRE